MDIEYIIEIALDTISKSEDKESAIRTAMECAYLQGKVDSTEERMEELV